MKSTKYVGSGGLAFSEERDMKKLSEYAKKGWILEKFAPLGYWLRRGEPQDLVYSLDYQINVDEDYDLIFKDAGWTRVCSAGGNIHIFRATAGTPPIYTDKTTTIDKYEREKKIMGTTALPSLIALIVFVLVGRLGDNGWVPEIVGDISFFLSQVSLIVLVFSGMPYIAYRFKLNKLRK